MFAHSRVTTTSQNLRRNGIIFFFVCVFWFVHQDMINNIAVVPDLGTGAGGVWYSVLRTNHGCRSATEKKRWSWKIVLIDAVPVISISTEPFYMFIMVYPPNSNSDSTTWRNTLLYDEFWYLWVPCIDSSYAPVTCLQLSWYLPWWKCVGNRLQKRSRPEVAQAVAQEGLSNHKTFIHTTWKKTVCLIDTDQDAADVLQPVLTGAVYRYITAGRDGFVKDGDSVHMPLLVTSWVLKTCLLTWVQLELLFSPEFTFHFEIIVDQHWKPEPFGGHTAKGVAPKSYPSQSNWCGDLKGPGKWESLDWPLPTFDRTWTIQNLGWQHH